MKFKFEQTWQVPLMVVKRKSKTSLQWLKAHHVTDSHSLLYIQAFPTSFEKGVCAETAKRKTKNYSKSESSKT